VHIVAIPKKHIPSLVSLEYGDNDLLIELMNIVKKIASQVVSEYGACRVITNLGKYQDSKHLHFHVVYGQPINGAEAETNGSHGEGRAEVLENIQILCN
jgi:histidine triad (HIT) family protein